MENEKIILEYLRGDLSDATKKEFEQRIAEDEDFAREYKILLQQHIVFNEIRRESALKQIKLWSSQHKKRKIRKRILVFISVILSILIFYILFIRPPETIPDSIKTDEKIESDTALDNGQEVKVDMNPVIKENSAIENEIPNINSNKVNIIPEDKPTKYNYRFINKAKSMFGKPNLFAMILKGESSNDSNNIEKISNLYNLGNYAEVRDLILNNDQNNFLNNSFNNGVLLFMSEDYKRSIGYFAEVIKDEFDPDFEEARYYLILSRLALYPDDQIKTKQLIREYLVDKKAPYFSSVLAINEFIND